MMVNTEQPPPLSRFRGDTPPGFEAALLRCLEKDPARRYQNVAELAWAIAPFGPQGAQTSAERISRTLGVKMDATTNNVAPPPASLSTAPNMTTSTTSAAAVTASVSATTASVSATTATTPPRGRGVFIVAGALAVGLLGVVGFVVVGRSPSSASPQAALTAEAESSPSSTPSTEVRTPPKEPTAIVEPAPSASEAPAPSASAAPTATTLPAAVGASPKPQTPRPATAPSPTPAKTAPPKTLQMDIKD